MITSIERKIREREEEELYSFMTSTQCSLAEKLGVPKKQYARFGYPEKFKERKTRIDERRRRRWEQM